MNRMLVTRLLLVAVATLAQPTLAAIGQEAAAKVKVLLIDGQNNHQWQQTTPVIRQTLLETGLFDVTVATTPAKGQDMSGFAPKFSDYGLVVSNYNGEDWSESTRKAFEAFVAGGGGFVAVHAADNSFPSWAEYNRMIGLGGWGGRSEKDGPYVRWKEDMRRFTRDKSPGSGGTHGKRVPFLTIVRDPDHPITRGLPKSWMQNTDELYGKLRGPAENLHVLATAFSDPATNGTGEHEPILMTTSYGQGRVFHTTMGHDVEAMKGVAFQVTLQRGAEWAATGKVTQAAVGADVLTDEKPAVRDIASQGSK